MTLLKKVAVCFSLYATLLFCGCDSGSDNSSVDEKQSDDVDIFDDFDLIDFEAEASDSDTFDALPDADSDVYEKPVDDIFKEKEILATISGKVHETVFRAPYLFVAAGYGGLYIYEKKEDHLELIETVLTSHPAHTVFIDKNYLYLGCGRGGVVIIDVAEPTAASIIATIEPTDFTDSLFVQDNYLFIADGRNLVIVDVTDPETPKDVSITPYSACGDIFVEEKYAYITDDNGEIGLMRVVDISDPTNPQQTDTFSTDVGGDITVKDEIAYGSFLTSLRIIDVSDPYNLTEFSSIFEHTFSSCLYENHLYSARDDDVVVYDITNPEMLIEVVTIEADFLRLGFKVSASGERLYLSGVGNLSMVDISEVEQPVFKETVWLPTGTTQIYAVGNYLYTVSDSHLIITDITKPTLPQSTTSIRPETGVTTAFSTEEYTYIASGLRLYTYNTKDKTAPVNEGMLLFSGKTIEVMTAKDDTFFVVTDCMLYSVDISTPQTPQIISECILTYDIPSQITAYEDYLYLQGESSIAVYTVDKDRKTTFLADIDGCDTSLVLDGQLFALFGNKLTIYSLKNGATVTTLSQITIPSDPLKPYGVEIIREIHRYNDVLYITEQREEGNALIHIDISDIASPDYVETFISTHERCSSSHDRYILSIVGEYAYTLECSDIIDIFNIKTTHTVR